MQLMSIGKNMTSKLLRRTSSILSKIRHKLSPEFHINSSRRFSGKVFCVGFNKTGTTSTEKAFRDFGYRMGNQAVAEIISLDWHKQDFSRLIRYCQTADAFQDAPFSLPGTYQSLDKAFPDAKFILTVRDSKEQWYQSLVRFHTKLFSSDEGRPPNEKDLENALYRYKGFVLDTMKMTYNYPEIELYDFNYYTTLYEQHNQSVIDYFRNQQDKLLVLNVSTPKAYQNLASFLNVKVSEKSRFPWKNRSQE